MFDCLMIVKFLKCQAVSNDPLNFTEIGRLLKVLLCALKIEKSYYDISNFKAHRVIRGKK